MNNQIIDLNYIEQCKDLSSQELEQVIHESLDKQIYWRQNIELVPYNPETYDLLIGLLKEKLDKENKTLKELDENSSKPKWRVRKECENRKLEAEWIIINCNKRRALISKQKEQIELIIDAIKKQFNRLNKQKLSLEKIAQIIINAEKFYFNLSYPSEIKNQGIIYKLCNQELLLDIVELISSLPKIDRKFIKIRNKFSSLELDLNINFIATEDFTGRPSPIDHKRSRTKELEESSAHLYEAVKYFVKTFILYSKPEIPENSADSTILVKNLYWEILPQGNLRLSETISWFKKLSKLSNWVKKELDERRIERIENFLRPNKVYRGLNSFEGYVIYCFSWTNKVILECPYYGNATYVISDGWLEISKLTKWEAKYEHSSQVTAINHNDTWFERLKEELKR